MGTEAGQAGRHATVLNGRLRTVQLLPIIVVGTALSIGPTTELAAGRAAEARTLILAVASLFTLLAVRVARLAVVLTGEAVVIRNVFRSYRVERQQVAAIAAPARGRLWKTGMLIQLTDGRSLSASAFVPTPIDPAPYRWALPVAQAWLRG